MKRILRGLAKLLEQPGHLWRPFHVVTPKAPWAAG